TNAQSRAIEDKFRAFGLAYQIVGGVSFYQRREVKDTLAYLRLIRNPHDAFVAFGKVMTKLRGAAEQLALPRLLDEVTALTGYEAYLKDGTEEGEERW